MQRLIGNYWFDYEGFSEFDPMKTIPYERIDTPPEALLHEPASPVFLEAMQNIILSGWAHKLLEQRLTEDRERGTRIAEAVPGGMEG